MKVGDLVSRRLQTVGPSSTCVQAAELMLRENVGAVVVEEAGRPLGMLTDRDLVDRVMAVHRDPEEVGVTEVMTTDPIFLSRDAPVEEAYETMARLRIRRLVVVTDKGRLHGIISLDDLLLHASRQVANLAEVVRAAVRSEAAQTT